MTKRRMKSADLFNDAESSPKSRNVVLVFDMVDPRLVGYGNLLRPEREESEVAAGHVVVLSA